MGPKRSMPTDKATLIEQLVAHAAGQHPGVAEPLGLRSLLARRVDDASDKLDARAADLYLAAACCAGDAAAIAILDARLAPIVRPALARLGGAPGDDDEIVQRTRVALLVANATGACGLAGYTGRGELRAYIRAVAVRLALKRVQRETAPGADDPGELMALVPDARGSAELELLKHRYRNDVRAAFAAAFAALSSRERTLLRQHYLDGLTVDSLAPLHQAHRSTCARWIEVARVKIFHDVRRRLRGALGLDEGELERVVELVQSQLDLSLSRNLAASS
jgi:RNA polymerase sigma-70 factor, ECF subfamily